MGLRCRAEEAKTILLFHVIIFFFVSARTNKRHHRSKLSRFAGSPCPACPDAGGPAAPPRGPRRAAAGAALSPPLRDSPRRASCVSDWYTRHVHAERGAAAPGRWHTRKPRSWKHTLHCCAVQRPRGVRSASSGASRHMPQNPHATLKKIERNPAHTRARRMHVHACIYAFRAQTFNFRVRDSRKALTRFSRRPAGRPARYGVELRAFLRARSSPRAGGRASAAQRARRRAPVGDSRGGTHTLMFAAHTGIFSRDLLQGSAAVTSPFS